MGKMLNTHSTINALLTKIQLPKQKMRRHTYWCAPWGKLQFVVFALFPFCPHALAHAPTMAPLFI